MQVKERLIMNRYTVLVQADKLKQVIPIPSEFENHELEVVIKHSQKKVFNPGSYNSIFNISREEIDRDLNIMRKEWNFNKPK
jgi:hypothetical protein